MSAPESTVVALLTEQPAVSSSELLATPATLLPDVQANLWACVLPVGGYLVGELPDPRLNGHPGIRY